MSKKKEKKVKRVVEVKTIGLHLDSIKEAYSPFSYESNYMINGLKANTTYLTAYGKELTYDTTNDFYKVGVANTSTYLVLQAYINRNCIDNNVQLINKSTNKVVYNSFINNLLDDTSKSSKHDGYITYETSSGNVAVTYTQDQNQGSDINLGLIIGISVGAVVVIGAVITTIIIIKKKKAKKNV